MNYVFTFKSYFLFPVKNISIVGDFNNWDCGTQTMIHTYDDNWSCEIPLTPGTYNYKYVINDSISLNDPFAYNYTLNEFGELVSTVIVDENPPKERIIKSHSLHLDDFAFTYDFQGNECSGLNEKTYSVSKYDRVVLKLRFSNVRIIHTVTCLWYTPDNECHNVSENLLVYKDSKDSDPVSLWFWIDLNRYKTITGTWSVQVFVDGSIVHQDTFVVEKSENDSDCIHCYSNLDIGTLSPNTDIEPSHIPSIDSIPELTDTVWDTFEDPFITTKETKEDDTGYITCTVDDIQSIPDSMDTQLPHNDNCHHLPEMSQYSFELLELSKYEPLQQTTSTTCAENAEQNHQEALAILDELDKL